MESAGESQARVLWTVLGINAVMFLVELSSGLYARSVSLTGDSLDMLGDAVAYGSSLYVINLGITAKARSAILKGSIILASALGVLVAAIYRTFFLATPHVEVMGGVGILALVANLVCLILLTRHRNDDVNMSSVWLCSRNDIIANVSVLAAALLVYSTASPWPDLIVGLSLTILFTKSALRIFANSRHELRAVAAAALGSITAR
ncbi:MAG TPA: cation transporter [Pyrinomonadaceae bacterium]|nr:cation transporter [Pyrinomonadaceae bacterium]